MKKSALRAVAVEGEKRLKPVADAARSPRAPRRKILLDGAFIVTPPPRGLHRLQLTHKGLRRATRSELYELDIIRPILRGYADNIGNDAALLLHARILLEGYFGKGTGVEVAPDLRARLEKTRHPHALTLHPSWASSWGVGRWEIDDAHFQLPGLNFEQRSLIEQYRRYAIQQARRFWWKRTHILNQADLKDLEQVAQLELILTAFTFDPGLGFAFGTLIRKPIAGALHDWMRERYSVVHRSPAAWKRWREAWGGAVTWFDESLDATVDMKDGSGHEFQPVYGSVNHHQIDNLSLVRLHDHPSALEALTPRERQVLLARTREDRPSQKELAAELGIRADSVSKLEVSAREKFIAEARRLLANKWQK